MSINKTLSVFALACSFFSTVSFAEKYQVSGSLGVLQSTIEENFPGAELEGNDDIVLFGVKAYTEAVDTKKGPLAEAEFLSKSSFLIVGAISVESEATLDLGFFSRDVEASSSAVLVGGHLVKPHAGSSLILEGQLGAGDIKTIGFGVGAYLTESQTVVASYERSEVEDADSETGIFSVEFKGVQNLNNGTFIAGDLMVEHQTEESTDEVTNFFTTSADYYFNRQLSAGLTVGIFTGDSDGKVFGVQGSFFPVESVGINAYLTKQEEDDFDISEEVLGLELEVRI